MSTQFVSLRSPAAGLPTVRWLLLGLLLLGEVIALSLRFDTATLTGKAGLLEQLHHLPHIALAALAAMALCTDRSFRARLRQVLAGITNDGLSWACLLGHITAFIVLVRVTSLLLETPLSSTARWGWITCWLLTGSVTLALWLAAALPPRAWPSFAVLAARPIAAGVAVGAAAWAAGQMTHLLWRPLSVVTLWLVWQLLAVVCTPLVYHPEKFVIGTPAFAVEISPECSGYEGIGLIWVFVGAYLWLFRGDLRFPHAFLLLPVGTAAIYLLNAVRIAVLVLIGSYLSPNVAVGGFHSQAGWLAFLGVALGLAWLAGRLTLLRVAASAATTASAVNPTVAYLSPLLVLLTTMMATTALSSGFDWLYPLRVLAVVLVLAWYWREYVDLQWSWSWMAVLAGGGVYVLWLALEPANEAAGDALATDWARQPRAWGVVWLLCRVVGSVVTVPLAEELAFRGYLIRRLQSADFQAVPVGRFTWVAFVGSSLLFGALHGRWLAGTLAGMAYAGIVYRRGRLSDAVLAHATTNGLLAIHVLATGSWSVWA